MQNILTNTYLQILFQIIRVFEKRAALLLGILLISGLVLYMYFLGAAVIFAVEHKQAQQNIAQIHSELSSLEAQYLNKEGIITVSTASVLGLGTLVHKNFMQKATYLGQASVQ